MENKQSKTTKGDLERRIRTAIVLVPKDKDYKGIYFDDKGLRLEITIDAAVISTAFHKHVFNSFTASGVSRPYLYVKHFIDIALANDCTVKDAKGNVTRSYTKLIEVLKGKEDKSEYNMCWYIDLWLNNIFHPLYGIGESRAESFLVYESYLHNIARNKIILSEKVDGMTNKGFVDAVIEEIKLYTKDMEENEIFPKMTDKERMEQEIEAVKEHQIEETLKDADDGKR